MIPPPGRGFSGEAGATHAEPTTSSPSTPPTNPTVASANPAGTQPRSQLALRLVAIDTWRENVAYLHRDCAVYRAEGFQALSKIKERANGLPILATVNVVDDSAIVGADQDDGHRHLAQDLHRGV